MSTKRETIIKHIHSGSRNKKSLINQEKVFAKSNNNPKKSREPKRGMQSALIWGSHRRKHVGMSKQLLISKKTGHVGAIFET